MSYNIDDLLTLQVAMISLVLEFRGGLPGSGSCLFDAFHFASPRNGWKLDVDQSWLQKNTENSNLDG